MRKPRNKGRSRRGFTLAETLVAILILLMASAIVAGGIPAATRAYEKVVTASNAEVLLSTTISTLRNELGTAQSLKTPDPTGDAATGTLITYYNPSRGASSRIYVDTSTHQIMFQRYYSEAGFMADYAPAPLIPEKTATGDLYVTYTSVVYSGGILTFRGLSVNRTSGATGLAARDYFSIRIISDAD